MAANAAACSDTLKGRSCGFPGSLRDFEVIVLHGTAGTRYVEVYSVGLGLYSVVFFAMRPFCPSRRPSKVG